MPRAPRIQYPGAIYHVINRGNYRSDVFSESGTAFAFVETLKETVERYGWRLGAYVVMRNHFHLAIQTPEPNLVSGMHWLQCTFATRFNRIHREQGHVFQGRYKAIVLQNNHVWARVNDYIHLNPVRAGIVPIEQVSQFRWSSLGDFVKNQKFNGLSAIGWFGAIGLEDTEEGWRSYVARLVDSVSDGSTDAETERALLTRGWATGDEEWKQSLATSYLQEQDGASATRDGRRIPPDMLSASWRHRLEAELATVGKSTDDVASALKSADWKIEVADRLQRNFGVPISWLAKELNMGKPGSVRAYLWKLRKNSQVTT